ncbi:MULTISPECIES: hypothetical protein [unclassified Streptomyces]|uniref:hypothetical protein n=1 Tax=unclassified Streptomyces TaxID=2593676 RepID=UPI00202EAFDB|nr:MULTISPECIES: hypothetical protein [unclassified Streptomyces]MCM1969167.1 hypothetical protein [Streptomyces sp. G1]MCX5296119.1 hypothetical protein [Streptomyces sp. NBC_00193]
MTTQPDHGAALIPRPERTPDAVRVALARITPHRLAELEQHKENALAAAIRSGKIGHLTHWLDWWMREVEIGRRPDLFARRNDALAAIHRTTSKDDPGFRPAMDELAAVEAEAAQAVNE